MQRNAIILGYKTMPKCYSWVFEQNRQHMHSDRTYHHFGPRDYDRRSVKKEIPLKIRAGRNLRGEKRMRCVGIIFKYFWIFWHVKISSSNSSSVSSKMESGYYGEPEGSNSALRLINSLFIVRLTRWLSDQALQPYNIYIHFFNLVSFSDREDVGDMVC